MADVRSETAVIAAQLMASDAAYFAAGAVQLRFTGGAIHWMPGLQHLAAGCMIVPVDAGFECAEWTATAASALDAIGSPIARFYLPEQSRIDRAALRNAGFADTSEWAMARSSELRPADPTVPDSVRFRSISTDMDWSLKQQLAAAMSERPDGKGASPDDWTILERRKAAAGYGRFWLIEQDGTVCGTFGIAQNARLLRLKNLAVHPDFRRRGIGRAAIAFALERAREHGDRWVGAFALAESSGADLYRDCGFAMAGCQTEWMAPVNAFCSSPVAARAVA